MSIARFMLLVAKVPFMGKTPWADLVRSSANTPSSNVPSPTSRDNIGFVFTSGDLKDIRGLIIQNKVVAPARVSALLLEMTPFLPETPKSFGCEGHRHR
jgi:hypothetical protein